MGINKGIEKLSTDNMSINVTKIDDVDSREITKDMEISMLENALSDSIQTQAELQLELTNTKFLHEQEMKNLVDGDAAKLLFDTVVNAKKFMDARQDQNAWYELDDAINNHSASFGVKVVDPLSTTAVNMSDMSKYL